MRDFLLDIEAPKRALFSWWPIRLRRQHIHVKGPFKLLIFQRQGKHLASDPIEVEGYLSSDRQTITVTIGWRDSNRLKRHTTG